MMVTLQCLARDSCCAGSLRSPRGGVSIKNKNMFGGVDEMGEGVQLYGDI